MPGRRVIKVQIPSGERTLDGAKLRVHNFHVKAGIRRDRRNCGFCGRGLEAISSPVEAVVPKDGVVKSDRDNAEGATPPARSDDGPRQEEATLPWQAS